MADADEIPVSAAEQAFLAAMNDEQEAPIIDDARESSVTADGTTPPEINGQVGEERDSEEMVPQEDQAQEEEAEQAEQNPSETTSVASRRDSTVPSISSPPRPTTAGAHDSAIPVSESISVQKDEAPDATPSAPTTPATPVIVQGANWEASPSKGAQKNAPGKRKRLAQDLVGQLEDRTQENPRGDVEAWLQLIEEHKRKSKFDDARAVYEKFFVHFPQAAQQWTAYVKMELDNNELGRVENLFSRALLAVPDVGLWGLYLDYIRRRNNLTNDPNGKARTIISQAYDFVLNNIGFDKEAGRIWQDQIAFVKSGPGNVGGTGWMDQQKMDMLRKVYQKAVTQPVIGVEAMWREYDSFEHALNKITAKKFLQERSPSFMTARACLVELTNLTRGLRRETIPRLPPAPGYDGEDDWNYQVALWKKWIKWEKEDPIVLSKEDPAAFRNRIIYAYKQALMALRFWPDMWFEAAEYCFDNDMEAQGMEFLKQGLQANPESTLLTFKYAERLEHSTPAQDGEAAAVHKGQLVRKPYNDLLDTLYALYAKMQTREKDEIAKIEEEMAGDDDQSPIDDDDDEEDQRPTSQNPKEQKINEVKEKSKVEMLKLSKVISAVWINLMRAMRRIQGHGRVNEPLGGSRQIFADARKRGKITSDVYVASALIEYHCYRDPAALKIFERGMKLFPEDEDFALEYLKHLVNINDITNARAMFETFVSKVAPSKCQRVYQFFHHYEAHYGDLIQVYKLERRMAELYPTDANLEIFSSRYSYHTVDPCQYRPVISPQHQLRPKAMIPLPPEAAVAAAVAAGLPLPPPPPFMAGVGAVPPIPPLPGMPMGLPNPPIAPPAPQPNMRIGSPKRAANDDDDFSNRARKLPRADSPVPVLKGAAGRRLNQIKQQQAAAAAAAAANQGGQGQQQGGQQQGQQRKEERQYVKREKGQDTNGIPEAVWNLLTMIPGAERYNAVRFRPEAMVGLLAGTNIPPSQGW